MGLDQALEAAEGALANEPKETVEPVIEKQDLAPDLNVDGKQPQAQSLDQAIADLSKYEKVILDGKEWTRDELKKSIMRNEDYTKKTQELSKVRQELEQFKTQAQKETEQLKFESNYAVDLEKIRAKPHLAAEFMRIYPKEFHDRLFQDLQNNAEVDPKYLHLLKETHETKSQLDSFTKERQEEKLASIDQGFEAQETKLLTKYPDAHFGDVYSSLQAFAKAQGFDAKNLSGTNLNLMYQKMEEFAKQSHEQFESKLNERLKSTAKAQIEANKKGTDIGRGGGTPSQAPAKVKLKDAADEWMKHLNG